MTTFKTFIRSCTDFKTFASARKITVDTNLSREEAVRACYNFNSARTEAQKHKGTKLEFTEE